MSVSGSICVRPTCKGPHFRYEELTSLSERGNTPSSNLYDSSCGKAQPSTYRRQNYNVNLPTRQSFGLVAPDNVLWRPEVDWMRFFSS
jgi:hypothetical protein